MQNTNVFAWKCVNGASVVYHYSISAAGAVDREFYSGFFGFLNFWAGFWGPGGLPAARSRNSGPDGLRENPK